MHNPTVVHRHAVLGLSGVPASLCACVPPAYVKYYTQEDTPATGLVAEPKGASPPRQLELAPPGTAEFVICDHTIEFNFRDAKQSWGLEDFMNVTPTGVTNAAHLSLFMVNVAYRLRADSHLPDPDYSVLDLKADCRGAKYVEETIKLLPEKPEPILLAKILNQVASLGRIHAAPPSFSFA